MNIRNNLLKDDLLKFKEIDNQFHNNPLLQLESITAKRDWSPFFTNHQIYLGLTNEPLIRLDDLKLEGSEINPDLLIFASRHRSETARPAFLVHTTGNWSDKADYGGNAQELSKSSAMLLKMAYSSLESQRSIKEMLDFSLDIEVSHHGPTSIEKPLIFMELGSSEKEWKIEKAALVVGHAILNTCLEYVEALESKLPEIGIGFGGTHYAPQFKKLVSNKNVAVSFICPKYYIQDLTKEIIEQMISNNLEPINCFLIDWKGTNSDDKKHLIPILEGFDLPIKKTRDF
jgi:D-aminoacyl-tRNA deacylase